MNLLLIRHGEIPSNVKKIYAGRSAEKLTPKGVAQAEEVADKLKFFNVHSIYSSPVQRAIQTAEIIGERIRENVVIDNAFREMEMGPWEGSSESDVARMYPREWNIWQSRPSELRLPGRETLGELQQRVLTGIRKIYQDITDFNVVIVTHVAIIRVLLLWDGKKDLNLYKTIDVPNAEIFNIKIESTCLKT